MIPKVLAAYDYAEYNIIVSQLNLLKTLCKFNLGTEYSVLTDSGTFVFVFASGVVFTNIKE